MPRAAKGDSMLTLPAQAEATEKAFEPKTPASLGHDARRLFPASWKAIFLNYCSAAALLLLGYTFYSLHPFYQEFFAGVTFTAMRYVLIAYLVVLPIYYATFPDSYAVKCRLVWRAVFQLRVRWPTAQEKVALRAALVKAFYLPLMIHWLLFHMNAVQDNSRDFLTSWNFTEDGFWVLYRIILLIDVLCFAIAYGVEHPWLGNEIRSVEPTMLGWVAALACYPPCVFTTKLLLGWYSGDRPAFATPWIQALAAIAMLVLMGLYAWASVALLFKASNLTHRGIVSSGPYAWVRHPAYISKNLAWWVGALPLLIDRGATQPIALLGAVLGLSAWSAIYALRAYTEERHLGQDPVYQEYCRRVPWRFIPGWL